jgi:hypothetical protein
MIVTAGFSAGRQTSVKDFLLATCLVRKRAKTRESEARGTGQCQFECRIKAQDKVHPKTNTPRRPTGGVQV